VVQSGFSGIFHFWDGILSDIFFPFIISLEYPCGVVEEDYYHEHEEYDHSGLKYSEFYFLRDFFSGDPFVEYEHEMTAVKERDRQYVEKPDINADEGYKSQICPYSRPRAFAGHLRDHDRTSEVSERSLA